MHKEVEWIVSDWYIWVQEPSPKNSDCKCKKDHNVFFAITWAWNRIGMKLTNNKPVFRSIFIINNAELNYMISYFFYIIFYLRTYEKYTRHGSGGSPERTPPSNSKRSKNNYKQRKFHRYTIYRRITLIYLIRTNNESYIDIRL